MSRRLLGLALVPALSLLGHSAFAQAPGETSADPQPMPPSATPVVVENPCGGCIDPMASRFAIGLNLGGMSVTVNDDVDQTETQFRTGELSIRYRLTPHLEAELLLSGGRQVLDNGDDGDLAMGGGTLAARYRFRPDRAWNWWLMAGLGATVIERHDSTKDERSAAQRGHLAIGIGLERRFRHFAIHADLRALGISPRDDMGANTITPEPPGPTVDGGTMPPPPAPLVSDPRTGGDLSAAQFTLGASFYF